MWLENLLPRSRSAPKLSPVEIKRLKPKDLAVGEITGLVTSSAWAIHFCFLLKLCYNINELPKSEASPGDTPTRRLPAKRIAF